MIVCYRSLDGLLLIEAAAFGSVPIFPVRTELHGTSERRVAECVVHMIEWKIMFIDVNARE